MFSSQLNQYYVATSGNGTFKELFGLTDNKGLMVGGYIGVLIGQTLVYQLLAVWLDGVIPSEFGIHRDPWYCFMRQSKKPTVSRCLIYVT